MTLQSSLRSSLFVLFSLALAACTGQVDTDDGGGGSGGDGQGTCETSGEDECTVGDVRECDSDFPSPDGNGTVKGTQTCIEYEGCARWGDGCAYNTPIVLSFDGAEPQMVADSSHGFDLNGGVGVVTDWVSAKTPWLALDRNNNGSIDDGSELFGSMTPLVAGGRGRNGFAALRDLDADGDGAVTPLDPGFASLVLWRDADGDRRSSASELVSVASARVVSIEVGFASAPVCDARGNCAIERAPFHWIDERGALHVGSAIDVHFAAQR